MLGIMLFAVWKILTLNQPRQVAETYIRALASGDVETALKSSSGSAAYAASRLRDSEITASVEDVSCSVDALGRGWARVLVAVELVLRDGSADLGWYSLDVVKIDKDWRVVSFRETGPELSGTSLLVSQADTNAAKRTFENYLTALTAGDFQGSAKYLVGPARRSHEAGAATLGRGAVIDKVEDLKGKPVWGKGNKITTVFAYKADGRDVSVMVELYRTKQGWKIVRVFQQ